MAVAGGLVLLAAGPAALGAQTAAGNSAWTDGRYGDAKAAYERALAEDSSTVRAWYRLAILLSWEDRLDSALVLLHRARALEPDEPDVRFYEAQVLSWSGNLDQAIAKYDSMLAEHPDNRDAAMGRAKSLAWQNRFDEAEAAYGALIRKNPTDYEAMAGQAQISAWKGDLLNAILRYQAILERDPDNPLALIGLAQAYHWQGRERLARSYADRAIRSDSTSREGREVRRAIRAALRPQVEGTIGWSHDSDDNTSWWQTVATSLSLAEGLRGFASAGALEASDPVRDAHRIHGEAGLSYATGNLQLTGAVGARRLSPDAIAARSEASYRAAVSYRLAPSTGAGIGYAHYPFDETALLIGKNLDVDAVEANLESDIRPSFDVSLGAGKAWLSDGNGREHATLAAMQTFRKRFGLGVVSRVLAYDFKGSGYFSPDRFLTAEARGVAGYGIRRWEGRLSLGFGLQQVGKGASVQSQWHFEGRVARRWSAVNEVALSAGISNSAVSSTTGAFRYTTASLTLRLGL